ncbi:MAG: hypothetical protein ABIQ57_04950 [Candidatus Kapaibacterium sp.]
MTAKLRSTLLVIAILIATGYPALIVLDQQGLTGAFRFFAADTFYYLSVADHSIGTPFYTADGINPTNGFHPLWQYFLTFSFSNLIAPHDQSGQILFTFLVSLGCTAAGTALFGLALFRLTRSIPLSLLSVAPGAYWIFCSHINGHYGAVWSSINGMESSLSIFLFGLLSYVLLRWELLRRITTPRILVTSALITLIVLSRLDDIFFLPPLALFLLRASPDWKTGFRRIAIAAIIPTIVIGGYMIFNLRYAGTLLPISGIAKSGLSIFASAQVSVGAFVPVAPFIHWDMWQNLTLRIVQIGVPMFIAGLWLAWMRSTRKKTLMEIATVEGYQRWIVGMFGAYVLLKGGYNFVYVAIWNQGHWYFPLSIMIGNMMAARWGIAIVRRIRRAADTGFGMMMETRRHLAWYRVAAIAPAILILATGILLLHTLVKKYPPGYLGYYGIAGMVLGAIALIAGILAIALTIRSARRISAIITARSAFRLNMLAPVAAVIAGAAVIMAANTFIDLKNGTAYNQRYIDLWNNRRGVIAEMRAAGIDGGLLEFDDGILSYSLGIPTLNGLGLTADRDAFLASTRGRLLDTAARRGFHTMASLVYFPYSDSETSSSDRIRDILKHWIPTFRQKIDGWNYSISCRDTLLHISFIDFRR